MSHHQNHSDDFPQGYEMRGRLDKTPSQPIAPENHFNDPMVDPIEVISGIATPAETNFWFNLPVSKQLELLSIQAEVFLSITHNPNTEIIWQTYLGMHPECRNFYVPVMVDTNGKQETVHHFPASMSFALTLKALERTPKGAI